MVKAGKMKRTCNRCGNEFETQRANALYCGHACKMSAYRKRRSARKAKERQHQVRRQRHLLEQLRAILPVTARRAESAVAVVGWDCVDVVVKLCLSAYHEAKNGA
jgi:hypothetical protein